jgi:hypothetical protein
LELAAIELLLEDYLAVLVEHPLGVLRVHVCGLESVLRVEKNRHAQIVFTADIEAVLTFRGLAIRGKHHKVCIEVLVFVFLVNTLRPTGERNAAISPFGVDEEPGSSISTQSVDLVGIAIAVFEDDILNRFSFSDSKRRGRRTSVIHGGVHTGQSRVEGRAWVFFGRRSTSSEQSCA